MNRPNSICTASAAAASLAALLLIGGAAALRPQDPPAAPVAPAGPTASGPPAVPAASFPQCWIGHWKGDAFTAGGTRPLAFRMELIIAATDAPDRFTWTTIYDGPPGRQERAYTLIVKDAAKGEYAIDENNGIVLQARLLDGGLYTHFMVQGSRIATRERLEDAGTAAERISVEMVTTIDERAGSTGGKDSAPEVKTWTPVSIQKATLRR